MLIYSLFPASNVVQIAFNMSADDKDFLIMGANTGLGLEVIKSLYTTEQAYDLIVRCRTISKGEAAIDSITKEIAISPSTLRTLDVDPFHPMNPSQRRYRKLKQNRIFD